MPKLLPFEDLKEYGVFLSRRQIDRLEAQDKFPKRVPVSHWRVGWVADEIDQWTKNKIAARSTKNGSLGSAESGKRNIRRQRET
jgi:prophage regulatory protein